MENTYETKSINAYKKVEQIKKFYWFLVTAVFASLMMLGMAYFFSRIGAPNFLIWIFLAMPLVFVVVLLTEYMRVFDKNPIFGKKWEARKIKQFMEKDREEAEKYR